MYSIEWARVFSRASRARPTPVRAKDDPSVAGTEAARRFRWLPLVSRTVWALGLTSLLTDISSEMVASVLPAYLVLYLGISPIAFGLVDGIYQGVAALVRLAGGVLADRWRRHKAVAAFGYGLSAACRLLILIAGNAWGMIATIITLDRLGKGIRTAPRDALIARRSDSNQLATAFGVHRAMDAVGAMLGPVLAFSVLALMPRAFDVLFVASFGVAIVGLGAIVLFVPSSVPGESEETPVIDPAKLGAHAHCNECGTPGQHCGKHISLRTVAALLAETKFRALIFVGALLGLTTVSDSFIYLNLQKRLEFGYTAFPLLAVGTWLFASLLSIPCGRLADRIGRARVMLSGYGILALTYGFLLLPFGGGAALALAVMFLLGLFYATTDGVLAAMASAALPVSHVGSGLALLGTATSLVRLPASVLFGFLWMRFGAQTAMASYLGALVLAVVFGWFVLNRTQKHAH